MPGLLDSLLQVVREQDSVISQAATTRDTIKVHVQLPQEPWLQTELGAALLGVVIGGLVTAGVTGVVEWTKARHAADENERFVLRRLRRTVTATNRALEGLIRLGSGAAGFGSAYVEGFVAVASEYEEYQNAVSALRPAKLVKHVDAYFDKVLWVARGALPIGAPPPFQLFTYRPLPHGVRVRIFTQAHRLGRSLLKLLTEREAVLRMRRHR